MSSATSIDPSTGSRRELGARNAARAAHDGNATADDPGLRPWQFFVLAGMLAATAVVIVATGQSPASIIILSLTVVATSLVALAAYRTLAPLAMPETAEAPTLIAGRTRVALEREKTLVLRSIKDLEFDFAMGKIAQSDFDEMSARLRARAIGLMRQLEAGGYKGAIEQELATRLGTRARAAATEQSAPAVVGLAAKDHERPEDSAAQAAAVRICQCGVANDADAKFCKECGARLE
jgi:hypothetical protein